MRANSSPPPLSRDYLCLLTCLSECLAPKRGLSCLCQNHPHGGDTCLFLARQLREKFLGAQHFSVTFQIVFGSFFICPTVFRVNFFFFSGAGSFCRYACRPKNVFWGEAKVPPFWGSPLFYTATPRQLQRLKCKLIPSKM